MWIFHSNLNQYFWLNTRRNARLLIGLMYSALLIITWLADSDRNRKLWLCPTDYGKVALNIQGKWPIYLFCCFFFLFFCMWFASNEKSRILIRYQYFFCNRKTRWQLSLFSERHQNVRIYHRKYNMFVPIELLSTSFKKTFFPWDGMSFS